LCDIQAIAAWQPGAPVQRLRARARGAPDPRRLGELLTGDTPEYVIGLMHRAIEVLDGQAADNYIRNGGHDDLPARRGLVHAAVADVDVHRPAVDITTAEAALLLHQPCADPDAARNILELLRSRSPIVGVLAHPRNSSNPLTAEWIRRLQPADDACELGFWRVRFTHGLDVAHPAYKDPLNHHAWVVATTDTIYSSAARSVPATGQLIELFYEQRAGLFRDSIGQVWPLPATGWGATGTGPKGGRAGRETLVKILTNLILDAGGDVTRREVPYTGTSLLADRVATTEPPAGDPPR